jgi:hypothetical protein
MSASGNSQGSFKNYSVNALFVITGDYTGDVHAALAKSSTPFFAAGRKWNIRV